MPRMNFSDPPNATIGIEFNNSSNDKSGIYGVMDWLIARLELDYEYTRKIIETNVINTKFLDNEIAYSGIMNKYDKIHTLLIVYIDKEIKEVENIAISIASEEDYCGSIIITDGSRDGTLFLKRRFDNREFVYTADFEIGGAKQIDGLFKYNAFVAYLDNNADNIFFEMHSYMRDIDGLHADEALDELCKIIYAKSYDEEMSDGSFDSFLRGNYISDEDYASTIRYIYDEANRNDIRVLSLKIPQYKRSRGVFNSAIKLSSECIVKCSKTLSKYNLTNSPIDIKGRAFQKVISSNMRSGMGQYFTPHVIGDTIVKLIKPSRQDLILDPFCGSGHFLTSSLKYVISKAESLNDKLMHEFMFNHLHGIEKSDRMVRIAMTDMRLNGDGHSNIRCTDSLLDLKNYPDMMAESFDVIMTNPPFGSIWSSDEASRSHFYLSKNKSNVPLEILGLERSLEFLRPGGKLAIVLPDGILTNRRSAFVRKWIDEVAKLIAIIELPIETFAPYGANVKTTILILRKWKESEIRNREYKVYLAKLDGVGYDSSGRPSSMNELGELEESFEKFINLEGW